jgi:lipoprotein NlpD
VALAGCAPTKTAAPVREARPPAVKAAPAKAPPGHYRVLPGDTLYKIAFEQGVDWRDLAQWNQLVDPDRILAHQLLRVSPPKPEVTTAALPASAAVQSRTLVAAPAGATEPEPPEAPPEVWVWPSRGGLLSRYGEGLNKGIDIAGQHGQTVQAAAGGKVVYAGSGLRGYGKLIIIRHGKTLLSAYAHNARLLVAEGHTVTRGQAIAEMGDTDTDRVKLHFEIREYGKPVDPLHYLPRLS